MAGVRATLWVVLFVAGIGHADPAPDARSCLRSGERLTFVVKALGMKGGHLRIATSRESDAAGDRLIVSARTATEGFARSLHEYDNDSISIIDAATGQLKQTQTKGIDGKKRFDRVTVLDRAAHGLVHTDRIRPQKSYQVALPPDLVDLSLTMLCARSWKLGVGESRKIMLTYEGEVYELVVNARREENVSTPLGKFKTLVLEPAQLGTPKGAFKKGTAFRMYLSREALPRLVRFDSMGASLTMVALLERVDEGVPLVVPP